MDSILYVENGLILNEMAEVIPILIICYMAMPMR